MTPTHDAGDVAPPTAIGDFVWFDEGQSELQDPDEPGIPGVGVHLLDPDGNPVVDPSTG